MPDAAGISGLGYSDTDNPENAYYARAISPPLAVRQKIALSSSDLKQGALPLASVEGTCTLIQLSGSAQGDGNKDPVLSKHLL